MDDLTHTTGWELVEQGRFGLWNTVTRLYGPYAYVTLEAWRARNTGRTTALRPVHVDDAPLAESPSPDPNADSDDTAVESGSSMPDRNTTAKNDGYIFANRLAEIFKRADSVDNGALFGVARRFAKFEGYSDADGAFAYIEGFVQGFGGPSPKQLESGAKNPDASTVDAG